MDYYLFDYLHQLAGQWPWLDSLAIFLAGYLEYILVSIFLIWLLLRLGFPQTCLLRLGFPQVCGKPSLPHKAAQKNTAKLFLSAVISIILSRLIITELIRFFYYRPRPFVALQIHPLLEHSATGSFPSGHAAFFFALSTVIYLYNKKAGLLFFAASFLICLARIFVGLHYPFDILAGAAIGIFSGWLVKKIQENKKAISSFLVKNRLIA